MSIVLRHARVSTCTCRLVAAIPGPASRECHRYHLHSFLGSIAITSKLRYGHKLETRSSFASQLVVYHGGVGVHRPPLLVKLFETVDATSLQSTSTIPHAAQARYERATVIQCMNINQGIFSIAFTKNCTSSTRNRRAAHVQDMARDHAIRQTKGTTMKPLTPNSK